MPKPSEPASRGLRRAMVAVAVAAVLAAAPGAWVRSTYGAATSADEPHYLLTALSLFEDGDLNVDDELDDERWRAFHEARLPQQSAELEEGRRVAPHDPLLPALLAVPMGLGGYVGARLALALVAGALAAATLWVAVRRFAVPVGVAAATVGVAAASAPLFVYGSQVYPELPAALAVVVAVGAGLGPVRPRDSAIVGLAVVALPWLAVKYVPVAAAVAVLHLLRVARADRRHAAALVGGYAAAGVAYVAAHLAWYGGITVYAAGDFFVEHGGQHAVFGTRPNIPGRTVRLVGLLVDRTFGLAAWQPAWLAAVPALAVLASRRPAGWLWLAVPAGVGWLNAAYVAVTMHGWWFPGRQVVVVLPLVVVAVAWWLGRAGRGARVTAAAAAALGLWTSVTLVVDGLQRDVVWIVDFFGVQVSPYGVWRHVLPDYHRPTAVTWWLHAAWLSVLGAAAVGAWRGADRTDGTNDGPPPSARIDDPAVRRSG